MSDYLVFQLQENPERWVGQRTEQKLDAFTEYVEDYLTILGKQFISMDLWVPCQLMYYGGEIVF